MSAGAGTRVNGVNWKMLVTISALAGGVVWAASRRVKQEAADAARWAEATDTVTR
jgi:hypothetical protein